MLALLLSACLPPILLDTGFEPDTSDTAADSADSSDGDTDSDSGRDTGRDTGSDTGSDTGRVPVTVENIVVQEDSKGDPHAISAVPDGPGRVAIDIQHYTNHGCATVTVTAELYTRDGRIVIVPVLDDTCDPKDRGLGILMTLVNIPAGAHEITDHVATTEVTVE